MGSSLHFLNLYRFNMCFSGAFIICYPNIQCLDSGGQKKDFLLFLLCYMVHLEEDKSWLVVLCAKYLFFVIDGICMLHNRSIDGESVSFSFHLVGD